MGFIKYRFDGEQLTAAGLAGDDDFQYSSALPPSEQDNMGVGFDCRYLNQNQLPTPVPDSEIEAVFDSATATGATHTLVYDLTYANQPEMVSIRTTVRNADGDIVNSGGLPQATPQSGSPQEITINGITSEDGETYTVTVQFGTVGDSTTFDYTSPNVA